MNVDHVATVRQARREIFTDPVELALAAVESGADGITAHLREDRRHIQDNDIFRLKERLQVPLNMEMAVAPEIVTIAKKVQPAWVCLVPEKRQELTTEGGLAVVSNKKILRMAIESLKDSGIQVSLFMEPDEESLLRAKEMGADAVELHTGRYAQTFKVKEGNGGACGGTKLALNSCCQYELSRIVGAAKKAKELGLVVNAGHGLDYGNMGPISQAFPFNEFNIGFAIIAKALSVGMAAAVKEMKEMWSNNLCVES